MTPAALQTVLLLLLHLSVLSPRASAVPLPRAEKAFTSALAWLSAQPSLAIDTLFQLRLVEGALPGTPSARAAAALVAAGAPTTAGTDPTYERFAALAAAAIPPHAPRHLPSPAAWTPDPADEFDEDVSDNCLAGALGCSWAPGCQKFQLEDGRGGYRLTHQVLFALFVERAGCGNAMGVDPGGLLRRFAPAMLAEAESDAEFSDLFAERITLGLMAGFRGFLRREWVAETLKKQEAAGCWRPDAGEECTDHATGMAAVVLAYWIAESGGG
ncbi:hypothetical protein DFJ74DRAFT_695461 [Hyaloraphidium curvatum]|nr:hypothetical protein DFJ74DRAFT_695461 [Hyaloraphidium curvatum]